MIFCTATAPDRFDEAYLAIQGLRHFYPEVQIVFDAILCSKKQVKTLSELAIVRAFSRPPRIFNYHSIEQISTQKNARNHSPLSLLCAAWRVFMLADVMKKYKDAVMWFDTDVLIVQNFTELFNDFFSYDVALHLRENGKNKNAKILSAVCLFNNSYGGREFLKNYAESYFACREKAGWYADQRALVLASEKTECKIMDLPSKYLSSHWTLDNPIWHLKQKKRNKIWKNQETVIASYEVHQATWR